MRTVFFLLHIFLVINSVGSSLFFVSFLVILSWSLFALLASGQKSFVKCPFCSQLSHVVSRVGHIRDGSHQFPLFVFHRTFSPIILVLLPLDFFVLGLFQISPVFCFSCFVFPVLFGAISLLFHSFVWYLWVFFFLVFLLFLAIVDVFAFKLNNFPERWESTFVFDFQPSFSASVHAVCLSEANLVGFSIYFSFKYSLLNRFTGFSSFVCFWLVRYCEFVFWWIFVFCFLLHPPFSVHCLFFDYWAGIDSMFCSFLLFESFRPSFV